MNDIMKTTENNKLEAYYNSVCKNYNVSCKVLEKDQYLFSNKKDRYLVLSINDIPADLDVKDIYIRNERSNVLFYTDYFVAKIDENTKTLELVEDSVAYCKTVKFLKDIYSEYKATLPQKIRGEEVGVLKEYNIGRNNRHITPQKRKVFKKGLAKFFKQEKSKSKHIIKWKNFVRSDRCCRTAKWFPMRRDFWNRKNQIVSVSLLHETNDDLKTTVINEHEFRQFQKDIKNCYPDVLYAVSDVTVETNQLDALSDAYKNVNTGTGGSLQSVSYEFFCSEREKRFADEGYTAINNLLPTRFETRQLTYKEIDEPFVASVLNSIRYKYAKSDSFQSVQPPDIDTVSFIDVPVEDMMNFVSLAKANEVPFYLDCFGKLGKANFETVRVVYSPTKDELMNGIVSRMINEKFEFSHIATSVDQSQSLDKKIDKAHHLQLKSSSQHSSRQSVNTKEL